MKYAVVGTTVMNKTEVIKSLESLWDARDAADDSFELVVKGSLNDAANDPETIGVIKQWIADLGCLHETAEDIESFPQVDAVLALVGQEPDDETLLAVYHFYDRGVTVYDLASQMVELQFSDQVEEEPPADEPEPPATTGITGGWPGEAPETPAAAPDPTPSREVPAKAQEDAQEPSGADSEDPAVILAGVTEVDLERMGKAELKALVERLGLDADKRSPGSMINAIMEVVIAIDKGELEKAYGAEAEAWEKGVDPSTIVSLPAKEALGTEVAPGVVEMAPGSYSNLTQEVLDAQREKDQVEVENNIRSQEFQASSTLFHPEGSDSVSVVAKFIETVYSDGTVSKVPLADF